MPGGVETANTPLRSGFVDVAPPRSFDALLEKASLIFVGKVGPVEQYLDRVTYEDGQEVILDTDATPVPGLVEQYPVTDFRLQVDEVLRDDGTIAASEPVFLRVLGHITEEMKQSSQDGVYPVTYTGDRYLFLLSPYPDGKTHGFYYGPWSRLIIDGDILRISNGDRDPLVFDESAGPVTLEEFRQAVADR